MMHDRNYQEIIENICREIQPYAQLGRQADYIPALASVDPDKFGIYLSVLGGDDCMYGDYDTCFSIQSIAKVFSLAIALSLEGENMWMRLGKEPSGTPFNSLVQLEYEHGRPRNPFINAGALVVADVLLSHLDDAQEFFIQFVRQLSGNVTVDYSMEVAESEYETAYLNASIAYLLKHYANLHNPVDEVLRFYSMICSVEMNCRDLARAFVASNCKVTKLFRTDQVCEPQKAELLSSFFLLQKLDFRLFSWHFASFCPRFSVAMVFVRA